MVNVFIWSLNNEWVFWCSCSVHGLPLLLDIAKQSAIDADWLGF